MATYFEITSTVKPQRIIKGWINDQGYYCARLYTNNGETACHANKEAKKLSTILKWAQDLLASDIVKYSQTAA